MRCTNYTRKIYLLIAFFLNFFAHFFCAICDGKRCQNADKDDSASKQWAKHPFAGQKYTAAVKTWTKFLPNFWPKSLSHKLQNQFVVWHVHFPENLEKKLLIVKNKQGPSWAKVVAKWLKTISKTNSKMFKAKCLLWTALLFYRLNF